MDSKRFDSLTYALASTTSRRGLLRGVLGGAAALAGLKAASGAAAPAGKVDICHYADGSYHRISVSLNAYDAHVAHGDLVECEVGFALDMEACACVPTNACTEPEAPCGDGGRCVTDIATGSLICVDDPSACFVCASSADCVDEFAGQICISDINDDACGGHHCHPLHGV